MSDKSELKAELERKKQRLAQIREEKKRKEEERKKKEVCLTICKSFQYLQRLKENGEETDPKPLIAQQPKNNISVHT